MGFTVRRSVRESVISFKWPWCNSEEDLPYFRGAISCGPRNDSPWQETFDWGELDDDHEGSVDEAREW